MIVPTPDYDPLFADDGVPFGEKMRQYIRCEFADVLGPHVKLLATDQGLDTLSRIYVGEAACTSRRSEAA